MGRRKATPTSGVKAKSRPATTPEARENQLISLAYDLVEQRLLDGTATSQETTSLIRLGTSRARLEAEKLKKETELLRAKADAVEAARHADEMYLKAIEAMKVYTGNNEEVEDGQDIF